MNRGRTANALRGRAIPLALRYAALLALLLVFAGPFLWMLSVSFRGNENIFDLRLLPRDPTFRNYVDVFRQFPLARAFANSVLVAAAVVAFNVLLCSLAAYPLARMRFPGRRAVFLLILSTLMIPFQLYMIPLFVLSIRFGLADSLWGLILPWSVGAFGIYLVKQHYAAIPASLEEAARIDGAGEGAIWLRIMLPLARPSLAALAIFVFVQNWGDFLWPLIILNSDEKFTLPVAVARLSGSFIDRSQYIAAGAVVAAAPVIVFFFFMQRHFLGGLTLGAVKG